MLQLYYAIFHWLSTNVSLRYNPPYSTNVATNIGKTFLKIVGEEFPLGHTLHRIFNLNTIKISYSCMKNVKQVIDKVTIDQQCYD